MDSNLSWMAYFNSKLSQKLEFDLIFFIFMYLSYL